MSNKDIEDAEECNEGVQLRQDLGLIVVWALTRLGRTS